MSSTTRTTLRQALCSSSILLLLSLLSLICIPLTTTMVKTQAVNVTEVAYILNDFMGVHTGSQLPEILRLKGIMDVDGIASMSFATQLRDHPFQQLLIMNPLFLWLHPTDLNKQGVWEHLLLETC